MKIISANKTVTIPGFKFSGISAGIKKTGGKDLALIFSETEAVIAGVFTTNKIKAAPVKLDRARISRGNTCRAIIINSGNANACTGPEGLHHAKDMAKRTAEESGIPEKLVYVASTGVIGVTLPMKKIRKAIPEAVKRLSDQSIHNTASAILTTDTFPKVFSKKINLAGKTGIIAGIAKGAGMISPNMATMLCFIVTDIAVEPGALDSSLRKAVTSSFNRLTVDADMSTNDTVLIMANGMLKNRMIRKNSGLYAKFNTALTEVTSHLSRMIAQDGEGATKIIEIIVKKARTENEAEKVARSIANSLLVKTALYGKNPNWGRIMAAIGYSGINIQEKKINIYSNACQLVHNGTGTGRIPKNIFSRGDISITIDLGLGKKEAKVLTCDLTEKYIKINARHIT